jgi:hypothetical protein
MRVADAGFANVGTMRPSVALLSYQVSGYQKRKCSQGRRNMTVQGVNQTTTPKLPQNFQLDTWNTVFTKELTNQTQLNSKGGIFSQNGANIPQDELSELEGFKDDIDQSGLGPHGYVGGPGTQHYIDIYLAANGTQGLKNLMSVLGADRTYAVLANMSPDEMEALGIQDSLKKLVADGTFTAADANALAQAQANSPTSWQRQYGSEGINGNFDTLDPTVVGNLINSLPNDQNGSAVKAGYMQGSLTGAQKLTTEILSGKYSGEQLQQLSTNLNSLLNSVDNISTFTTDAVKLADFKQLRDLATQFANKGDTQHRDLVNAYAADILGSLGDKSQVAATLRGMDQNQGGVHANGYIDPNSNLAAFLNSALNGQAQFKPGSPVPQGVTGLLNGIALSGDAKLAAGTLDTVMQWSIANPKLAAVLAKQDTMSKDGTSSGTGYRDALTSLLDNSFNQFIALDKYSNATGPIRTLQLQTMDDLQALTAIELGLPHNSKSVENFVTVYMRHAAPFAGYAADPKNFPLVGPLVDGQHSSAVVFAELINNFAAGLNKSETSFLAQAHDAKTAADFQLMETRITTDVLRALGTGLLLASAWVTGGPSVPIALGLSASMKEFIGIVGRVGLFSGSTGTLILDQWLTPASTQNQAQAQEQLLQKVEQQMHDSHKTAMREVLDAYGGWFSVMSHLSGPDGRSITDGLLIGSGSAAAPTVDTPIVDFYRDYNPF